MANIITASRILLSIALLFPETFSALFYCLYIACGVSDMADGFIARATHTESDIGEKLDSAADIVFVAVCLFKIVPAVDLWTWILVWTAVIAAAKIPVLYLNYKKENRIGFDHSFANRATGLMLFLLPLTNLVCDMNYGAAVCCTAATAAVFLEIRSLWRMKNGE